MKDSFSIFIYCERFIFSFSMRYIEKFEYLDDIFKQSERDSSSQETSQSPDIVVSEELGGARDELVDFLLRLPGLPDHFLPEEHSLRQKISSPLRFCLQLHVMLGIWRI